MVSPSIRDATRSCELFSTIDSNRAALLRMTVREKLGQMSHFSVGFRPIAACEQATREGLVGSFINCPTPALRNRLQRIAIEESRLGIPLLFGRDVIRVTEPTRSTLRGDFALEL